MRGALKLEIGKIEVGFSTPGPRNGGGGFIEGGQRPVTAAPPFWVIAIWDLIGMTGRVYVRKVSGCNRRPAGSWQIPCRVLADSWQILANLWILLFRIASTIRFIEMQPHAWYVW